MIELRGAPVVLRPSRSDELELVRDAQRANIADEPSVHLDPESSQMLRFRPGLAVCGPG